MKILFRIRWELILAILLLITSVSNWVMFGYVDTSIQTLSVATMTTFALMYVVIGYRTIETLRHESLKLWQ